MINHTESAASAAYIEPNQEPTEEQTESPNQSAYSDDKAVSEIDTTYDTADQAGGLEMFDPDEESLEDALLAKLDSLESALDEHETLTARELLDSDTFEKIEEVEIETRDFLARPDEQGDEEPIDTFETHEDLPDTEEEWTRNYPYEVPRPALSIEEASTILGKSVRSLERSILGKWGNKLPEGWKARRMRIDGIDEWRIIPPPGFRVRHTSMTSTSSQSRSVPGQPSQKPATGTSRPAQRRERESASGSSLLGFSLEKLLASAGQKAKNELVRAAEFALDEHPTIVIDRSDDVERLLRELAEAQKELAEERKMHLQDLRLLADIQGSMRLLEMNASQTSTLKEDLELATTALREHKRQYQEFLNLPWWKRLFRKNP